MWGTTAVFCQDEDGLRVPIVSSSTVTRDRTRTTVHYPFGKVEIPNKDVWNGRADAPVLGKLHARTIGTFGIRYSLARNGAEIVAQKVRVWVTNSEHYMSPATPALREHESMHGRINNAHAQRVQKELRLFRTGETDPAKAEALFKAEFNNRVAAVEQLHAEWDNNDVFLSSP